jgi:cellulose synthase/poly-beta-1,6-N-acetylglucosamine synthase-like glycosyltransferase
VMVNGEKLMQGPVFQISNFNDVGIVGKAAGIELSMYHLSTLSRQLLSRRKTARFLAGTNYFVDCQLMIQVGGWNEQALVEDAELGLRLFLQHQVRAAWLPCCEVEQTPPDRKVYLKQRERWALGHFQLLPMIRSSALPWHTKVHLQWKVLYSVVKSAFDIGLPVLGWTALALGWTSEMPSSLGWVMLGLLIGSVFVWDFFGRGVRLLNKYRQTPQKKWRLGLLGLQFILAMPWLIFLQAQPRITAFFRYLTGWHNGNWEKTRRTVEVRWEPLAEKVRLAAERGVLVPDEAA